MSRRPFIQIAVAVAAVLAAALMAAGLVDVTVYPIPR